MLFLAPLLLRFPLLGKLPWRLIGVGVLLAGLAGGYLWHRHSLIASGRAQVQALWDADTARRDAATAEAKADLAEDTTDAVVIGVEEDHGLEEKLAAAVADRDGTFRLLQRARSEVRACASGRATDAIIAADASAQERADAVDRAVAGVVTEHRMNADQLDALISVLERQQVCPIVRMD